jgi:hypothetical protein
MQIINRSTVRGRERIELAIRLRKAIKGTAMHLGKRDVKGRPWSDKETRHVVRTSSGVGNREVNCKPTKGSGSARKTTLCLIRQGPTPAGLVITRVHGTVCVIR